MPETMHDALSRKVAVLERQLRLWKSGTLLTVLLGLSVALMGVVYSPDKVVVAERFVLKDADGKIRAILGNASYKPEETKAPDTLPSWGLHIYGPEEEVAQLTSPNKGEGGFFFVKNQSDTSGLYVSTSDSHALLQMTTSGKKDMEGSELRLQLNPEYGHNISLGSRNNTRIVLGETNIVNTVTDVTERRPLSSIVLFDKNGRLLTAIPR
jgi:hypothetical protein